MISSPLCNLQAFRFVCNYPSKITCMILCMVLCRTCKNRICDHVEILKPFPIMIFDANETLLYFLQILY